LVVSLDFLLKRGARTKAEPDPFKIQHSAVHTEFNVPVREERCAHASHKVTMHRGAGLLTQKAWDETDPPPGHPYSPR
jgi:hypothetical protein